eukprot:Gregarina_sp_Poly_1__1424@NODE_1355_length_4306_cov_579_480066_g909_i0_p2_GENE_NODE_1355_length_4306_cov_579_480066_g909_i0NODE_1355_length_4306_cov_579_480066_g909_i0_p2_ORF_typecomplete_len364_score47_43Aldo_ket_red/PF00248_21/4_4e43_NODE_1355_length_4306_cov_579_480066_g909_i021903281
MCAEEISDFQQFELENFCEAANFSLYKMKTILCGRFHNGVLIPVLGLGSFQLPNDKDTEKVLKAGIHQGYRHIDTALAYNNHTVVGNAIRAFNKTEASPLNEVTAFGPWEAVSEHEFKENFSVPHGPPTDERNIFITSKVFTHDFTPEKIKCAIERMTQELQRPADLILLHWPAPHSKWSTEEAMKDPANINCRLECWKAFEEAYGKGLVRAIGVSNYMERHLMGLIEDVKRRRQNGDKLATIPMVNQFEISPFLSPRRALLDIMSHNRILATGFCTLGSAKQSVLKNDLICGIAETMKKTPSQIIISWCLQNGYLCIPRTSNEQHAKENFDTTDFELSSDFMDQINGLHCGERVGPNPDDMV